MTLLRPRLVFVLSILSLVVPSSAEEATQQTIAIAGGALEFEAPSEWPEVTPGSRILEKELSVQPPEGTEAAPARLTLMSAGGSVQANLARWVGQFKGTEGGADRSAAETEELKPDGMPATLIDLSGTYMESAGGPFGPKTPRPNYRMVAAIVETGGSGNYFFKLVGPEQTVGPAAEEFKAMIGSIRKK
ncbi:MAG: hypothetical protein AAF266_01400 [Planctomycetota bacterium]